MLCPTIEIVEFILEISFLWLLVILHARYSVFFSVSLHFHILPVFKPEILKVHAHFFVGTGGRAGYLHVCLFLSASECFLLALNAYGLVLETDSRTFILATSIFKKSYLLNHTSEFRSVFTVGFIATRSSKLDPAWICFDEIFQTQFFGAASSVVVVAHIVVLVGTYMAT